MATPYEEIVQAAKTARQNWTKRNDSARKFIEQFVHKFIDYCQMPTDRLKLMPWDEERQLFSIRGDEIVGFYQAVSFDEDNDQWRVGLSIIMTPPKSVPLQFVSFGLFVTEKDSQHLIRVGDITRSIQIDLNDKTQTDLYFSMVIGMIKESFLKKQESTGSSKFGFHVGTS